MLAIFRKYQRILYIIITVVIVISFSFFGTYGTVQDRQPVDHTAFVAVDGSEVLRSELESMTLFLGTDNEDKLLLGGQWGPNFLNDGVIKKDFFETGMAGILVEPFLKEIGTELQTRHNREKHYSPYQHPQASFISAQNAWNMVAPDINKRLIELRNINDPASANAFNARAALFLAERKFPDPALRMVLKHQMAQYDRAAADQSLAYTDLALFGYHSIDDWFGSRFTRLAAEFVINSAIIAKERGYEVSRREAAADLYQNAELSFQQNIRNPRLEVTTAQDYLNEQLRRMGMDFNKAVETWQKVMLFRRLFHDFGNSVLIDAQTVAQVLDYSNETVEGQLYQLPEALRLGDFRMLQAFETYLSAISNRPKSGPELLKIPKTFKTADEISKEAPELVERRFVLEVAKVDKKDLQSKVSVKETWNWEVQNGGWEKLKKKFPELGVKKGETEGDRTAALDALDIKTRQRVDAFARAEIIEERPEWITQALQDAQLTQVEVGIRKKGENKVFSGLKDPEKLIKMLDAKDEALSRFSADQQNFYRITVLENAPKWEILTFGEAYKDGILAKMVDSKLQAQHAKLKTANPKEFDKPFDKVRGKIAEEYFANILKEITVYYAKLPSKEEKPKEIIGDYAASIRLMPYMQERKEMFKKDPGTMADGVIEDSANLQFNDQWKLVKKGYTADRTVRQLPIDQDDLYALKPGEWTSVQRRANGDITFFELNDKKPGDYSKAVFDRVMLGHKVLAEDAQRVLMRDLVDVMVEKHALVPEIMKAEAPEA